MRRDLRLKQSAMQINTEPKKVVKLATIRRCITTLNNAGVIKNVGYNNDDFVYNRITIMIVVPTETINTKKKRKPSNRKQIK